MVTSLVIWMHGCNSSCSQAGCVQRSLFTLDVCVQAIAEVNEKLQSNMFRRVMGQKVVSELQPASDYYVAEEYHQQYLQKGGNYGRAQNAEKGATDKIRCYG